MSQPRNVFDKGYWDNCLQFWGSKKSSINVDYTRLYIEDEAFEKLL